MISYLEGAVLFIGSDCITLKTGGIGYSVWLSKTDLAGLTQGQPLELFIHTHVREDALELFGFASMQKKQMFLMLTSVSGIGPKLSLAILSTISLSKLAEAISKKDLSALAKIPGIGKKTAERMCLELKDKMQKCGLNFSDSSSEIKENLEQAIKGLGYNKNQIDIAFSALKAEELTTMPLEDLIKKAINVLSGNKAL